MSRCRCYGIVNDGLMYICIAYVSLGSIAFEIGGLTSCCNWACTIGKEPEREREERAGEYVYVCVLACMRLIKGAG